MIKENKTDVVRDAMQRAANKKKACQADMLFACVQLIGQAMSMDPTRKKGTAIKFQTGGSYADKDTWEVTVELVETANSADKN